MRDICYSLYSTGMAIIYRTCTFVAFRLVHMHSQGYYNHMRMHVYGVTCTYMYTYMYVLSIIHVYMYICSCKSESW